MKNTVMNRVVKEIGEHFEHYSHMFGANSKVIDIGTGTGLAAQYLRSKGINVVGIDIIDYGNYRGSKLVIYDGIRIPFSDSKFDIALLLYVLRHAKNALRLLQEATRVAKKIIVIEEFLSDRINLSHENSIEAEVEDAIGLKNCPPPKEITRERFEEMVATCNLGINKIKKLKSKTERKVSKYLYIMTR